VNAVERWIHERQAKLARFVGREPLPPGLAIEADKTPMVERATVYPPDTPDGLPGEIGVENDAATVCDDRDDDTSDDEPAFREAIGHYAASGSMCMPCGDPSEGPHDPFPGCVFRHAKSGNAYVVLMVAASESDGAVLVVYRRDDAPNAPVWVRPFDEWNELVELADGRRVRRFEYDPAATELRRVREEAARKPTAYIVEFTAKEDTGSRRVIPSSVVIEAPNKGRALVEAFGIATETFPPAAWDLTGWSATRVED
jgi:hypothetical protein